MTSEYDVFRNHFQYWNIISLTLKLGLWDNTDEDSFVQISQLSPS